MERISNSPQDTEALGAALAQVCWPGCTVAFRGDLGAGKTAFVRGMAQGLGITDRGGICAVEWSETIQEVLEPETIYVDIRRGESQESRVITIEGVTLP